MPGIQGITSIPSAAVFLLQCNRSVGYRKPHVQGFTFKTLNPNTSKMIHASTMSLLFMGCIYGDFMCGEWNRYGLVV